MHMDDPYALSRPYQPPYDASGERPRDRIPGLLDEFLRLPVPVDICPLTLEELLERRRRRDPFILRVDAEGELLYARQR